MEFGGILEQPLQLQHNHHHDQHQQPDYYESEFQATGAKLGEKPSSYPPGLAPVKGGAGFVDHLSLSQLSLVHHEDDVEDEEVTRATTQLGRERLLAYSPSPKALLAAALAQPNKQQKAVAAGSMLPPPAVSFPAWRSLPPGHSSKGAAPNNIRDKKEATSTTLGTAMAAAVTPTASNNGSSTQHSSVVKEECKPRLWAPEEDALLREAVELHKGRNWKLIAESVPQRTSVQCLQRWKHVLHPEVGKGSWTVEEDEELVRLVGVYGQRWSEIARHMPRRIGKRCRERWENHLKAGLRKDRWTKEEEKVLLEARARLGNRWTDIARLLDGRSVNQCKNHWYSLSRRTAAFAKDGAAVGQISPSTTSSSPGQPCVKLSSLPSSSSSSMVPVPSFSLHPPSPVSTRRTSIPPPPPQRLALKPEVGQRSTAITSTTTTSSSITTTTPSPLEASSALLALATGAVTLLASDSSSSNNNQSRPANKRRQLHSPQPPITTSSNSTTTVDTSNRTHKAPRINPTTITTTATITSSTMHTSAGHWTNRMPCKTAAAPPAAPAMARRRSADDWTEDDVKLLREAYRRYPGNWSIISKFLGRTEADVEEAWQGVVATSQPQEEEANNNHHYNHTNNQHSHHHGAVSL